MSDPFFDQLNAEIQQQLKKTKIVKSGKEARRKAANPFASPTDKQEWYEQREAFEAATWLPISTVALFAEEQCDGCGSTHRIFLQFMERQVETLKPANKRLRRVTHLNHKLPKECLIHRTTTHICADCCTDHGFDLESALKMISTAPVAASKLYSPEDINLPVSIAA